MKPAMEILFKAYRFFLSPPLHQASLAAGGCRFFPTCSEYGLVAIRQYGLIRGGVLLMRRLSRCQPWGGSGYDPPPSNEFIKRVKQVK